MTPVANLLGAHRDEMVVETHAGRDIAFYSSLFAPETESSRAGRVRLELSRLFLQLSSAWGSRTTSWGDAEGR